MSCGIYKIENLINHHKYIGLSHDIEKRFTDHKSHLNSKRKDDQNKPLYLAFKKYGIENFSFEIIEECPKEKLKEREKYWISFYNTYENHEDYNLTPGGDLPGYNTVHLGQEHGMSLLLDKDVIFCRKEYQKGSRSRDIWRQFFQDKISYSGFLGMWHGTTWKHIMPEVFEKNPHPGKYTNKDCQKINQLWENYHKEYPTASFTSFTKTNECYVGYATAYKMCHEPNFYKNK